MVFFVRITVNQSHLRSICKSTKFNPKIQRTIYLINFQQLRLHVPDFIRTVVITVDKAVQTIKGAILRAQAQASQSSNAIQLSLYYGIGRYVSINLQQAHWGAKALDTISERLQRELPGLRGFSSGNLKKMRIFYEEWQCLSIGSPLANQLQQLENKIEEGVEIGEKYA